MLNPDFRRLYTDALKPPAGFRFTEALATTYSLDLQTLLSLPLHLALFSADEPVEDLLKDGVALLEALRRAVDRMTIYAQASRVMAPAGPHVLFSLLEPAVVEVRSPDPRGAFHPKLWLLRFDSSEGERTRLRLLVLTRNVTQDDCWDLALTLEGRPGEGDPGDRLRPENEPLAELIRRVPDMATMGPDERRVEQAREMAELIRGADWDLPDHFDEVRFHTCGVHAGEVWRPESSRRLAVISPFLGVAALEALAGQTSEPVALISRPEALDAIRPSVRERFESVMTLMEEAELEDGEEPGPRAAPDQPARGLHAKAFILEKGWHTHVCVGSANASDPALVHGSNVELIAELIGKKSRVKGIDELLDPEGFGALLVDHLPPEEPETLDPEVESARDALEGGRREIAGLGLQVRFLEHAEGWAVRLEAPRAPALDGVEEIRAWLVTRQPGTAVDVSPLQDGTSVSLGVAHVSLLTSFVAFELTAARAQESVRFVTKLDPIDLPIEERDAAVVRDIIQNRDGFLRYVMLLLAESADADGVFGTGSASWGRFGRSADDTGALPVFEHLTRAYCGEPERLESIRRLLRDVLGDGNGEAVVPPEFVELWGVFERALEREGTADA